MREGGRRVRLRGPGCQRLGERVRAPMPWAQVAGSARGRTGVGAGRAEGRKLGRRASRAESVRVEAGPCGALSWVWLGRGVGDGMTGPVRVGFGFSGFGLLFLLPFPFYSISSLFYS